MEFRLIYEGPLRGQGAKSTHKWEIRRSLHPQLRRLWQEHPLRDSAETLLAHPPLPSRWSPNSCCGPPSPTRWSP